MENQPMGQANGTTGTRITVAEHMRACGTVVWLLHHALLNVGSEPSLRRGAHGATTLQVRQIIWLGPHRVRLSFPGRNGVRWDRVVNLDADVAPAIRGFVQGKRPRDRVFPIRCDHVNRYLRCAGGPSMHAQQLRTYHAGSYMELYLRHMEEARRKHKLTAGELKRIFRGIGARATDGTRRRLIGIAQEIAAAVVAEAKPRFEIPAFHHVAGTRPSKARRWRKAKIGALPFVASLLHATPRAVRKNDIDPRIVLSRCAQWGWDERSSREKNRWGEDGDAEWDEEWEEDRKAMGLA